VSKAWNASDTVQYAITGRRSCRSVSEIPGIIGGRGVRTYDGRAGSSKASVALDNMLNASTRHAGENPLETAAGGRVVTKKIRGCERIIKRVALVWRLPH